MRGVRPEARLRVAAAPASASALHRAAVRVAGAAGVPDAEAAPVGHLGRHTYPVGHALDALRLSVAAGLDVVLGAFGRVDGDEPVGVGDANAELNARARRWRNERNFWISTFIMAMWIMLYVTYQLRKVRAPAAA